MLTFSRLFSLWICCYSNVNYSISSWIVSRADFQRWSLEFIKDIFTVLKICHWNNFVFSVVNSYVLLDCCVEKFKPFISDALAFQRNMNSIYHMKFLKPFPVDDRLHKHKMLHHKIGINFLYSYSVHISVHPDY